MKSRALVLAAGVFAAVATASVAGAEPPASPSDLNAQVDTLFAAWNKPDTPGAAVAVIQHGKIVFEKGFGCANLEYGIPIKPETVFHVASVSKQFTAMAVVLLEQDGKLSIDDEVHRHLPELPAYGHPITLRQLLNHTSGVRDQWNILALAGWDLKDVITQEQILRLLFQQKELNFTPGERMLYSNGGFTLLAEIVRRLSGQPLTKFCEERIFARLGMTRTHFHLSLGRIVPDRAYSYEPGPRGFANAPLNYANVGATSLFTTAGDLARWLDHFRAPAAETAKAVARLTEPGVLNSGQKIDYALGIATGKYRGLHTWSHAGADAGYRSHVLWFPEQEFGVAVASNWARFNATALASQVADIYLSADFTAPKPASPASVVREPVALEAAAFDKFAGTYAFDLKPTFALTYTREGGRFYAQATGQDRFEIFPESATKFFYKVVDAQVTFVADAGGNVNRIVHHQGGVDQHGTRRVAPRPQDVALPAVAGNYWSEELETRYTFFVKDGAVFGRHLRHGEFALTAIAGDRYRTALWFMPTVEFLRDGTGEVNGAKLGGGRVTGIRFIRQNPAVAAGTND
jgi:CubicO group peptidase (beta-lactamase class C family)